ncbi:hypothetical protein V6R21_18315 [Limibacter armeniacum]|uniref:tetratricopeptide repeat protein n=1 Tax=Limibacter armeniacum TaxID=466084 RepID=UPI002FE5FB6D
MTISLPINDFLFQLFPESKRYLLDRNALKAYFEDKYTLGSSRPHVDVSKNAVHISMMVPHSDTWHPLYRKAMELNESGLLNEARILLEELVSTYPQNPHYHHQLALLLASQKQQTKAIDHCKKALMWNPDFQDALSLIGTLYIQDKTDLDTAMIYINHKCE